MVALHKKEVIIKLMENVDSIRPQKANVLYKRLVVMTLLMTVINYLKAAHQYI